MFFPKDIWNIIMSYFHSSYKKPLHYEAIMNISEFYYCVVHHRESYKYNLHWNNNLKINSYYMRLIVNTNYENVYNILNRKTASSKIYDEFVDIFKKYNMDYNYG